MRWSALQAARGKFVLPGFYDPVIHSIRFFEILLGYFFHREANIRGKQAAFRSTGFAINLFRVSKEFFLFLLLLLSLSLSRVERARTSSRVTLNFLARPPKTARFIVLGLEYDSLALFWHNSTDARFFFFFRPISDRGNKDRPRIVIRSRWKSHVFLCRVYKEHSCIVYY